MHWYEMETSITMMSSKSKYWSHTLNLDPTEPRFNLGDLLSKIDCTAIWRYDIWISIRGVGIGESCVAGQSRFTFDLSKLQYKAKNGVDLKIVEMHQKYSFYCSRDATFFMKYRENSWITRRCEACQLHPATNGGNKKKKKNWKTWCLVSVVKRNNKIDAR